MDRNVLPDLLLELFCDLLCLDIQHGEGLVGETARQTYQKRLRNQTQHLNYPIGRRKVVPEAKQKPDETGLCELHACLNADLVNAWFKYLWLEVGPRLSTLIGPHAYNEELWEAYVYPVSRLVVFFRPEHPFINPALEHRNPDLMDVKLEASSCQACTLTRIGSHRPTLYTLLAVIRSRISHESHQKHPDRLRLTRLVNCWLDRHVLKMSDTANDQLMRRTCGQHAQTLHVARLYNKFLRRQAILRAQELQSNQQPATNRGSAGIPRNSQHVRWADREGRSSSTSVCKATTLQDLVEAMPELSHIEVITATHFVLPSITSRNTSKCVGLNRVVAPWNDFRIAACAVFMAFLVCRLKCSTPKHFA